MAIRSVSKEHSFNNISRTMWSHRGKIFSNFIAALLSKLKTLTKANQS